MTEMLWSNCKQKVNTLANSFTERFKALLASSLADEE